MSFESKELHENPPEIYLRDMPDTVLDGRLGEICQRRMARFPIAYSWPALLAVASALIDKREENVRTNLYCAVVGAVHSGKSQAIEVATRTLGLERPQLMDTIAGSAESLIRETSGAAGNPRLFSPDELGHTLEKLQIEHSSFSFVLNSAFYKTNFRVLMGRKQTVQFDCCLSILGGLVEERFADLFDAAATAGLYDRFLFGLGPGNFHFEFRPYEGAREMPRTVPVSVHPYVWDAKLAWEKNDSQSSPRLFEISIRAAVICASLNGNKVLTVEHLKPHFELAKYQNRIRAILKPNPGKNFEGQLAHRFLTYLERNPMVTRRQLFRCTRAYDLGPSIAERALAVLISNGDIVEVPQGRTKLLLKGFETEENTNLVDGKIA